MRAFAKPGTDERTIVTAVVCDPVVLGTLAAKWEPDLFQSAWAGLVTTWCVRYFRQHGQAPGLAVRKMFDRWAEQHNDDPRVELVERFLHGLSQDYERAAELQSSFVLELADRHFNLIRLTRLAENLQTELDAQRVDAAQALLQQFQEVQLNQSVGLDPFHDAAALQRAFDHEAEALIQYPGALGQFFGNTFERDAFVAFLAPEKRGKSQWLLDVAWRAMTQRRRVAFFEAGDMSEAQVLRRMGCRSAGRPIRARTIEYPIELERDDEGDDSEDTERKEWTKYKPTHEKRKFKTALSYQQALVALDRSSRRGGTQQPRFRLVNHPNSTLTVDQIIATLRLWERDHWRADVIVVDYADILAPPPGFKDTRDQINATWKQLRRLSQEFSACVVTATQADAAGATVGTLSEKNFSDDKRKRAHVTAMVGINQSREEKVQQITRLNYLARRDDEYDQRTSVTVAGCPAIYRPAILSR